MNIQAKSSAVKKFAYHQSCWTGREKSPVTFDSRWPLASYNLALELCDFLT